MELQEYHVKRIFKEAGLPVLKGAVAYTPEEAEQIAQSFSKGPYFIKSQTVDGSRCYGVVLTPGFDTDGCLCITDKKEIARSVQGLLGHPTWLKNAADFFEIQKVYVEQGVSVFKEVCRLVFRVNFEKQCQMLTAISPTGKSVSFVLKTGLSEDIIQKVLRVLCCKDDKMGKSLGLLLKKTYHLFRFYGAVAVELNPVVQLPNGLLKVVDGRLVFDPNAVYKFPELVPLIDNRVGKERERLARQNHFRYMGMSGNIACVVNGIGLGWATVDLIRRKGGKVAALLDVGMEPTKEVVTKALKLVLSEPNVDGVLVNIFGGVTRCDLIAEGLIEAAPEMAVGLPLVVRMEGMNEEVGQRLLFESRLPLTVKTTMDDAIRAIIKEVKEKR